MSVITEVDLKADYKELLKRLLENQWIFDVLEGSGFYCVECVNKQQVGHTPSCPTARLLLNGGYEPKMAEG